MPDEFALFGRDLFDQQIAPESTQGKLGESFVVPPFSVLDARQGYWQERKRAWLALGIQSEVGRGANLLEMSDTVLEPDPVKRAEMQRQRQLAKTFGSGGPGELAAGFKQKETASLDSGLTFGTTLDPYRKEDAATGGGASTGTSIFDPVLCELAYRWFSPEGGTILDPFAGGSVRGIVAALLGRHYVGIDLSEQQILANREQAERICTTGLKPEWINANSATVPLVGEADAIFSCPPYGDLEVYSDDPNDLSVMSFAEFLNAYRAIIKHVCARLKMDRFASFVVGDYRDDNGIYRNFVSETIAAFQAAGLQYYNEGILVTSVGSLPIRAAKQFTGSRKLGKTHQNFLSFVKGDPKRAAAACNQVVSSPEPARRLRLGSPAEAGSLPSPAAAIAPEQPQKPQVSAAEPQVAPEPVLVASLAPVRRPSALDFALAQPDPITPPRLPAAAVTTLVTDAVAETMTPVWSAPKQSVREVLKDFEARGFSIHARQGKLVIGNASKLTADDRQVLQHFKPQLLILVPPVQDAQEAPPSIVRFLGEAPPPAVSTWKLEDPPILDGINEIEMDFETDGLQWSKKDRPIGVSIKLPNGWKKYLPFAHLGGGNLDENVVRRWFHEQVKYKKITNINTRFDIHMAREWGVDLVELGNTFGDVAHYAALLDDHRRKFNINILSKDFLGREKEGQDLDPTRMAQYEPWEVARRGESDVQIVSELKQAMWSKLTEEDLHRVRELEDQIIPVVCEMEKNAAPIDTQLLAQFAQEAERRYYETIRKVSEQAGFNFDASTESWERLFQHFGLKIQYLDSNKPTFKDEVLARIDHPVIKQARFAEQLDSLRSKIFKPYTEMIGPDGLLRFDLHQLRSDDGGTVSGRFSAPYIQQVPNHDNHFETFGEEFYPRELYVPGRGLFFAADAKQIEYRIFASRAKNPKVLEAYRNDPKTNFHKLIFAMISPYKKDFTYTRQKNLNFMKIYGGGLIKTAVMMGFITAEEGEEIRAQRAQLTSPKLAEAREINAIYARELPEVDPLLKQAIHLAMPGCDQFCKKGDDLHKKYEHRGFVRTIMGRRSRFMDTYKIHKALNAVIQGSAADIMKTKLVELYNERKALGFTMRMTIHDEVCGDVPDLETANRIEEILNRQSFDLVVPILWSVGTGKNWAEAK